jgi:thiol:disulfide interchange protein DsbG
MKKLLTLSLSLAALSAGVCVAGNWVAAPGGSAAGLMQRLDRAHWISAGAKSPGRIVYVFTDPNCPYCNDLWKAMRTARAPDVQVRYLLVAVINAESRGKDAAILESADPAASLEKDERSYDNGGIAPKSSLQPETAETISINEALMSGLHIFGTPGIVYLGGPNEVKVFAGMPDAEQLRSIVGKREDSKQSPAK